MKTRLIKVLLISLLLIIAGQALASGNIWPMFQYDAQHTGQSRYLGSQNNEVDWMYELTNLNSSRFASSQPIIDSKGTIYFGVGERSESSWGKLYAFNPNGTIKWEFFDLASPPLTPALAPNGAIYVPTISNGIYALNPDGTEKWRFLVEGMGDISTITVGTDGVIYFSVYISTDYTYRLYSLNPDGSVKWVAFGLRGGLTSPAIGSDGTIYMVWQGFRAMTDEQRGEIKAFNPDGVLKWSKPLEFAASSPAIGPEGNIYVVIGSPGYFGTLRYLVAFAPDGTKLWQSTAWEYGSLYTPAINPDGNIIVADSWSVVCGESWGMYVWCPWSRIKIFSPEGELLQTIGPDENLTIDTQPIIDRAGNIFIGRTVYEKIVTWPQPVKWRLDSIDSSGIVNWSFESPATTSSRWFFPVIGKGGALYAVIEESQSSESYKFTLYAFNPTEENESPVASFNWLPEEPAIQEEIIFDASDSYDSDGEIVTYNWDFSDGSIAEGKIVNHIFQEIGDYTITLTITDNDGAVNSISKTLSIKSKKWSFAIITDLHISRGYSDYDGTGYGDSGNGENYYLTERLKKVVNWINENKNNVDCDGTKCSIKFLAVLGDITNNAEKSEFLKAKSILDKLNDPNGDGNTSDGIPYIPVFGNHDVWPYTDKGEASSALGENYFEEIFWDENATNTRLLKERFDFQRDDDNPKYKNFAFSYKKMNFIGLDFDSRTRVPSPKLETGVWANAVLWDKTKNWLINRLNEFQGSTILFSHHPLFGDLVMGFSFGPSPLPNDLEEIREIIQNKNVLADFAGHIHGFYDSPIWYNWKDANEENYDQIGITSVNTTESLMMGSNQTDEYLKEHDKGVIKIVKVLGNNEVDYQTNEGKYKPETGEEKEFIALNPGISFTFTKSTEIFPCVFFKAHLFTQRDASITWDFGDGNSGTLSVDAHCYKKPGVYNVKLSAIDNKTFTEESINQKVVVEEGIIPKFIKIANEVGDKVEVISTTLEESLTKFGRTIRDTVLIRVKHSEAKPVGLIDINFEQATQDVDLTSMIADTNIQKRKSILYMLEWPSVVKNEKVLFVPK